MHTTEVATNPYREMDIWLYSTLNQAMEGYKRGCVFDPSLLRHSQTGSKHVKDVTQKGQSGVWAMALVVIGGYSQDIPPISRIPHLHLCLFFVGSASEEVIDVRHKQTKQFIVG
ncbi:MAG: hypothetical protein GY938_16455 [Ketobacter sp.]|nr:hypothetical protein [Ketobacter sp.]